MFLSNSICWIIVLLTVVVSSPQFYLHMDGRGNYEFKPITEETVEFGS